MLLKKHYFKIFHNFLYGNLATNRLYSFINFYNLINFLRPLQLSSTIATYSRLYLIKFLNIYFLSLIYYDTDSIVLVKPVFNKIINSRIFFFKASYKKLIINFY